METMKRIALLMFLCAALLACGSRQTNRADEEEYAYYYIDSNPDATAFARQVMTDTATFSVDLADKADEADVRIVPSPDNRIRIYYWVSGGGTSPCWTTVTQYRDGNGQVRSFYGIPVIGEDDDSTVTGIWQADNIGDRPVYFLEYYSKASSNDAGSQIMTAVIKGDTIVSGPSFKYQGKVSKSLDTEYYVASWYFKTNGEGWSWMFSYYPEGKQFYAPYIVDMELTGRYMVYQYDGTCFNFTGIEGPRYLHPSLRDFNNLVHYFKTPQHLVRVDSLANGLMRLALWNNPSTAKQGQKPVTVLSNGRFNSSSGRYDFALSDNLRYEFLEDEYEPELWLTKDGETVSKEERVDGD